jgi:hypothetical protein
MSYNGWTNYETWLVNLWLTNDQGSYNAVLGVVQDAAPDQAPEALKDWVETVVLGDILEEGHGLAHDLLTSALSEVDWFEIAAALAT